MDGHDELSSVFSSQLKISEEENTDAFGSFATSEDAPKPSSFPFKTICPAPGYCLKCHTVDNDKVFINICVSDSIPAPLDLTDEELQKLIEDAPEQYRVPLSLGEPHSDVDKSGTSCSAYDAVIHPKFYEKIETSDVFRAFFYYAIFQGLEQKYAVQIDEAKEYVRLQNKKYFGVLQQQNIRTYAKPMIMETAGENDLRDESPSPVITKPWLRMENVRMTLLPEQASSDGSRLAGGDAANVIALSDTRRVLSIEVNLAAITDDFDNVAVQVSPNRIMISHEPSQRRWMTYHPWQPTLFDESDAKINSDSDLPLADKEPTAVFDCQNKVLRVSVPIRPISMSAFKPKVHASTTVPK